MKPKKIISGIRLALLSGLTFIMLVAANAQQNIRVYKVGSSSFSNEIMLDTKAMLESSGLYTLEWNSSGYTRLDDFVKMPYLYTEWCNTYLPLIQSGNYNWVVFQTIDWYFLSPAQQEKLISVIIPDLTNKIKAFGANVMFYDKPVAVERNESDPLAKTWAGCYPQGVRFNNLQHVEAGKLANISKMTFGGGAVNELWAVPYFKNLDFLWMSGHPGPLGDYVTACALSYMLTNGAFNPVGNSVRKIYMASWAVEAFIDLPTSGGQALYNANIGRIDLNNSILTLTDWEADTLQRASMRWNKQWNTILQQNISNASTFAATMTEINSIRAERGNFAAYNLSQARISELSLQCADQTCGIDSINIVNSRIKVWNLPPTVENPAKKYLTSGDMSTINKDWKAYWGKFNSKWPDDIFFEMELYYALEKKCDSSANAAAEIDRLAKIEYVFNQTTALPYAKLMMERLNSSQRDTFIKGFVPKWLNTPGQTKYQPKFGAQMNAVINDWTKVVEVWEIYLKVWKDDPNLEDSLKWSTPPFTTKWWIEADNRFAAAWAAHVSDATKYTLSVNSGSGSGSYSFMTEINIVAATPPTGKVFDRWSGDIDGVSKLTSAFTLYSMPKTNATITALYKDPGATSYTLSVVNGSGGGSYTAGSIITIKANTPAAGKVFDKWTGNTTNVANVNSASTTITMPAAAATVTATYKDAPSFILTVTNGTGSGSHPAGSTVNISANAPASGKVFDIWSGNITGIANINNASTTITMPASNASITATYKDAPTTFTLTVISGTGSGSYAQGTIVSITANVPASGKLFDKWTGSITGIANVNNASTTITMPASNTSITATYKDAPPVTYSLTVTNGSGSGMYASGSVVAITANLPAAGKVFDKWSGNTSGVSDLNASSTTLTITSSNISVSATYKDVLSLASNSSRIALFPNPSTGCFWIISDVKFSKVIIINIIGRIISETQNYQSGAPLEIINEKGLFLVEIITEDGEHIMKRIVVE